MVVVHFLHYFLFPWSTHTAFTKENTNKPSMRKWLRLLHDAYDVYSANYKYCLNKFRMTKKLSDKIFDFVICLGFMQNILHYLLFTGMQWVLLDSIWSCLDWCVLGVLINYSFQLRKQLHEIFFSPFVTCIFGCTPKS